MKAYILNVDNDVIGESFDIDIDDDFEVVEDAAIECGEKCCIKWDRPEDGQTGYWSPLGATFDPYWYECMQDA